MTATPELYRRAVDEFDRRVRAIRDDQWHLPTPCTDWDVRALVNHVVGEDLWAPELFAGRTVAEVGDRFDGDVLGADPQAAWAAARDGGLAAVGAAGAMDSRVHVSWGEIAGEDYGQQLFADHLVHAWDLARAVGADERLDPELVEACYAAFKPREETLKASGAFGERIEPPADADGRAGGRLAGAGGPRDRRPAQAGRGAGGR